jgi:hypothetical protein
VLIAAVATAWAGCSVGHRRRLSALRSWHAGSIDPDDYHLEWGADGKPRPVLNEGAPPPLPAPEAGWPFVAPWSWTAAEWRETFRWE